MFRRFATWNVLHRIHAVNWSEPMIARYPDEGARVEAVADRVALYAADRIVALQEVSRDVVHALEDRQLDVVAAPYPRVPRYYRSEQRSEWPRDPTEYLVVVAPREAVVASRPHVAPTDPGKGLLEVELADGLLVIATHVSGRAEHLPAQLAELARRARARGNRVVILGDFNADRETVQRELGDGFVAAVPPAGSRVTRPREDGSGKSQDIDHAFGLGVTFTEVEVASADGMSDHNPVLVALTA